MTENSYSSSASRRGSTPPPAPKSLVRREPGLATLLVGLAVMLIALLLPQEHRPIAFYPALVCVAIGVLLTLRHGPDEPRSTRK